MVLTSARRRRPSRRIVESAESRATKRPAVEQAASRPAKKLKEAEDDLFKVEKILDRKRDKKNGATLYKIRWKGYDATHNTWEPLDNVASTGHVDRYERQRKKRKPKKGTAGVAVIEYDDGERSTVDLRVEKFRSHCPDLSDDERDDDTVNGDNDVNNFSLVVDGEMIEILWPHANMYFPCRIISWTPLSSGDDGDDMKPESVVLASNASPKPDVETTEPTHQLPEVQENGESSGLNNDVGQSSNRPAEAKHESSDAPHLDSSDGSDDEGDDSEGFNSYQHQYTSYSERQKLSFEELWTLKLKRTQELRKENSGNDRFIHGV